MTAKGQNRWIFGISLAAVVTLASVGGWKLSRHATRIPDDAVTQARHPGNAPAESWSFVVSGDSRNCGNVIMPAIAEGTKAHQARFYWHLGDFRALFSPDEDLQAEPEHRDEAKPMELARYRGLAWQDFIDNQLSFFAPVPVFLGIGNHETIQRERSEFVAAFGPWLTATPIRQAQIADGEGEGAAPRTYYHWNEGPIDFINLDNATPDQFDAAQMDWFRRVAARDESDAAISTIVLGMHEALPDSLSPKHSMSASGDVAINSGREVYREMLRLQNVFHKKVYILASHSHYYMEGVFNTQFWKDNGGVLPGWIVGTAGAARIPLPPEAAAATRAFDHVYGYLVATVNPDGAQDASIRFDFQPIQKASLPAGVVERYGQPLVDFCFEGNEQSHSKK